MATFSIKINTGCSGFAELFEPYGKDKLLGSPTPLAYKF